MTGDVAVLRPLNHNGLVSMPHLEILPHYSSKGRFKVNLIKSIKKNRCNGLQIACAKYVFPNKGEICRTTGLTGPNRLVGSLVLRSFLVVQSPV